MTKSKFSCDKRGFASMSKVVLVAAAALSVVLAAGCGKKISVEEGTAKLEEWKAKGVPEEELAKLNMYLFHMRTGGNTSTFSKYQDSLTIGLEELEKNMGEQLAKAGPFIDSMKKICDEKYAKLTGLHKEEADKEKARIDSLINIESKKLETRFRIENFSLLLDTLADWQKMADSLRSEVVGTWIMEGTKNDPGIKEHVERYEAHFGPDGKLFISERQKSVYKDGTFDNWQYDSRGEWDLFGDIIHHHLVSERRIHKDLRAVNPATGKVERQTDKPYDSTYVKSDKKMNPNLLNMSIDGLKEKYVKFPLQTKVFAQQAGKKK